MAQNKSVLDIVSMRLRGFMDEAGLSPRELSKRCGGLVSQRTIYCIRNRENAPGIDTLEAIADALNIPVSAFFLDGQITLEDARIFGKVVEAFAISDRHDRDIMHMMALAAIDRAKNRKV